MVCCEPGNGLRHRDPRTIPGCRWGSLACRPLPSARRIAVELAPSPRDRERRRTTVVRRRARAGRGHVVAPPRRAASPRTRGLARRSHGRCARGDIGDGDDGGSVGAASVAVARDRLPEPFDLDPVLRFVPRRGSGALLSAVVAIRLANFVLRAWLRPARPMSRLPRRDSSFRSEGIDPALCLRTLRFRSARRREDIGRSGGAAAGTIDRRHLQGGNR